MSTLQATRVYTSAECAYRATKHASTSKSNTCSGESPEKRSTGNTRPLSCSKWEIHRTWVVLDIAYSKFLDVSLGYRVLSTQTVEMSRSEPYWKGVLDDSGKYSGVPMDKVLLEVRDYLKDIEESSMEIKDPFVTRY
jgi:predicted NAD-dependent protein-ADP-ribosyltransferase YbiA (DUF1768 family)